MGLGSREAEPTATRGTDAFFFSMSTFGSSASFVLSDT